MIAVDTASGGISHLPARLRARPDEDVFEDRALELTAYQPLSVERLVAALSEAT